MGLLTLLIQRNAWEELHESLTSRRLIGELFRTDRLGRTPLHYACAKKQAPEDVVALMLHFYGTKWFTSRDICGNTPLHASAANSSAVIVKLLLQNLHSRRLQYVNDVGSTPLLMAWKKYLDPSFTLFGHVDSIGRKSAKVSHNMHLLRTIQDVVMLQDDPEHLHLLDVWNKTLLLVSRANKASTSSSSNEKLARPLHDILTVGGNRNVKCPTVAFWLALRLYSHHVDIKDEQGNLPIHLAAKYDGLYVLPMSHMDTTAAAHLEDDHQATGLSVVHATDSALAQLAKVHPKGALTPTRDDRLPIHLAIESGTTYNEGGICALVHAAPQTLEVRDVQTKLPPFLLAAASPKAPLTVVWELVRARPDLIGTMVHKANTDEGEHYCKRAARREIRSREEACCTKRAKLSTVGWLDSYP